MIPPAALNTVTKITAFVEENWPNPSSEHWYILAMSSLNPLRSCTLHTNGLMPSEPALQACWDADRLDLGRVGITPLRERLGSDALRGLLDWSKRRAITRYVP